MNKKPRVYLAGQPNEYENYWKEEFKKIDGLDIYDWEIHSNQTSPDTFFPDDLRGIKSSDYMIANPGIKTSEGTWIEIGYFYANNTRAPGEFCNRLIIIWKDERNPKWSIDFVKKTGWVVNSVEEAKKKLLEIVHGLEINSNVVN